MEAFWKAVILAIVVCVLSLTVGKQDKLHAILLTTAGCVMIVTIALAYIEPVLDFLQELQALGDLRSDSLGKLITALGIGLCAELCSMLCADAGNGTLSKAVQLLGSAAILYLSIPMFRAVLELVQELLGAL